MFNRIRYLLDMQPKMAWRSLQRNLRRTIITVSAVSLGLGTCWIGAFDEGRVRALLDIPPEVRVVELMTLGYPRDPDPAAKNRLPLEEIVRYENWNNKSAGAD